MCIVDIRDFVAFGRPNAQGGLVRLVCRRPVDLMKFRPNASRPTQEGRVRDLAGNTPDVSRLCGLGFSVVILHVFIVQDTLRNSSRLLTC